MIPVNAWGCDIAFTYSVAILDLWKLRGDPVIYHFAIAWTLNNPKVQITNFIQQSLLEIMRTWIIMGSLGIIA